MGSNDGAVFQSLRREQRPGISRFIEIHDPPVFVLSYTAFLDRISGSLAGRGLRRAVHRGWGRHFVRSFIQPSDTYICKTFLGVEALSQLFRGMRISVPVERIDLPNYLDVPPKAPSDARIDPKIGFFGYIHPDKGPHLLIEAAQRLLESKGLAAVPRIEIRGAPASDRCTAYIADMKRRVDRAGLSTKIVIDGFVAEAELPEFVAGLSAIALPYTDRMRSSASGPILWARTMGVPVIAHRTIVFSSYVQDGVDGRLVPIGDVARWADVMAEVTVGPMWIRLMKPGVEQAQKTSSWEVIAAEYARVLSRWRSCSV
jgi:glycosyltransferase involved in cell wall biosynthesis